MQYVKTKDFQILWKIKWNDSLFYNFLIFQKLVTRTRSHFQDAAFLL